MEIPIKEINPETLNRLIEQFVLSEGTDYGFKEHSLEEKVAQVKKQLENGEAKIVFDFNTNSSYIIPSSQSTIF